MTNGFFKKYVLKFGVLCLFFWESRKNLKCPKLDTFKIQINPESKSTAGKRPGWAQAGAGSGSLGRLVPRGPSSALLPSEVLETLGPRQAGWECGLAGSDLSSGTRR